MPELPEVETIKNQLADKIIGKKIIKVEIRLAKLIKGVSTPFFKNKLKNAIIQNVSRRAKLLIIKISNGYSLLIHLKLTGQLIFMDHETDSMEHQKYTHLIYHFSDKSALIYNDLRQFGYVKLVKTADLEKIFEQEKYGPEPLKKDFTLKKFQEILFKKLRLKIKPLLMDQSFIAGIGNIYAQEACFCAKILPTRTVKSLSEKEIKNLYHCLISILKQAIKDKGSSVENYVDASGNKGIYVLKLKVYGRENLKCFRCQSKIEKMVLAGRGTYYCPNCQK
ncbi:MAG: bifunctional DNA-formamidopyrimidine glycosylase/DNA-(apurinic or apyrimidinic site) lyase [Patescibacteria group bacterium]|nr:bifunctional DNA-formamidopyrimidine glycosylase/DNA-(apurinic or apyrimidinic site) lyase [Patescibacteria group bacterium]